MLENGDETKGKFSPTDAPFEPRPNRKPQKVRPQAMLMKWFVRSIELEKVFPALSDRR